MKYKLINKTLEETICSKVVVNGFDYYIIDKEPENKDYYWDENKLKIKKYLKSKECHPSMLHRFKVISTNNPNIDLPQVIDKVEELFTEVSSNPPYCSVVNRNAIEGYNKSQETHSFSEDDMIEFSNWYCDVFLNDSIGLNGLEKANSVKHLRGKGVTKELLQLWKERQIKTIYYK